MYHLHEQYYRFLCFVLIADILRILDLVTHWRSPILEVVSSQP